MEDKEIVETEVVEEKVDETPDNSVKEEAGDSTTEETDEGKANLLCQYLMRPHDFGKEFCETFGIHTECIRFSHPDSKKSEIIDMLKNFIYQLENIT